MNEPSSAYRPTENQVHPSLDDEGIMEAIERVTKEPYRRMSGYSYDEMVACVQEALRRVGAYHQ